MLVTIALPGTVANWVLDTEINRVEDGHRPGEREWRQAFDKATIRRIGRGSVWTFEVSAEAARELAGELRERADLEATLPADERLIRPVLLHRAADRIDAAAQTA